jgi:hypothetical protein
MRLQHEGHELQLQPGMRLWHGMRLRPRKRLLPILQLRQLIRPRQGWVILGPGDNQGNSTMAIFVGILLALGISLFATISGFDREKGFYPLVLAVSASYYDLFAIMGEARQAFILDSLALILFIVAAYLGFKRNPKIVAIALVIHGAFDLAHSRIVVSPEVPVWWSLFCMSYDFAAALYLSLLLQRRAIAAKSHAVPRLQYV